MISNKGDIKMEYLQKFTEGLKAATEAAVALLTLAVVAQVLFGTTAEFFPVNVVGNIVSLTAALGSQGLVGLVAIYVLVLLFNRK